MNKYPGNITVLSTAASFGADLTVVKARTLMGLGVSSYSVDIASGWVVYRYEDGKIRVHHSYPVKKKRNVSHLLDKELVRKAMDQNENNHCDNIQYFTDLAKAGVSLYEVKFEPDTCSIICIGNGDIYHKSIFLN